MRDGEWGTESDRERQADERKERERERARVPEREMFFLRIADKPSAGL